MMHHEKRIGLRSSEVDFTFVNMVPSRGRKMARAGEALSAR